MIYANFEDGISSVTTTSLYQWDTYQTLVITGIDFGAVTPVVHFCNKRSKEALVVSGILQEDDSIKVSVPNSLLTEKWDIICYIYKNTGITAQTISTIVIPIIPRLKPTEYVQPSDENIAEIEAIELEAKAIIDNLTASEYSNTETYKRPNIVYYDDNTYMCLSNAGVKGVLPTDTTKWRLICKSSILTGMSKDDHGNLVFTYKDGSSYIFQIATVDTNTADDTNIPALLLTEQDVSWIKLNNDLHKIDDKIIKRLITTVGDFKQNPNRVKILKNAISVNIYHEFKNGTYEDGQGVKHDVMQYESEPCSWYISDVNNVQGDGANVSFTRCRYAGGTTSTASLPDTKTIAICYCENYGE